MRLMSKHKNRILFTSTSGAGHFMPLVPFIRGCARQARVMLAGPEALRTQADSLGVEFIPVAEPPAHEIGAGIGRAAAAKNGEGDAIVIRDVFVRLRSATALPSILAISERWQPDVVLHEGAEFAGPLAAHATGIPHARVEIGLSRSAELFLDVAEEALAEVADARGLDVPDPSTGRSVSLFPASLEERERSSLPDPARYRDPEWDRFRAASGERTLIYVSFGSVAGGILQMVDVFRQAAHAASDLAGEVLMAVGRGCDPSTLGPLPPNVKVEQWVDQATVLSRAKAVVCHGGGGTTLAALAAGCPVVAVPLFSGDQHINARRVAEIGAGYQAVPEAGCIRGALTEVLQDPLYAIAAGSIADEIAAQTSADDALDPLLSLTSRV
jgi:UDP-glucoronosyl and UDP-glucosyl transferase